AVRGLIEDARTFTAALAAEAPRVAVIAAAAERTSVDAAIIAERLRGELDAISLAVGTAQAALTDARLFAAQLPELLAEVRPGVQNVGAVLEAIDPAAIEEIVENVRALSETLDNARGDVTTILSTAGAAARQVETVTSAISARVDTIGGAIENVASFAASLGEAAPNVNEIVNGVSGAVDSVRTTLSAVNTEAINRIIANVEAATDAIGSRAGEIGQAIDNAANAARGLSEGLGTLGGEDGTIRQVLDQAKRIAANLEAASSRVGIIVDRAGNLFDGPVQRLVANVSGAAGEVGDVDGAFASRAPQIADGLARFTRGGLDDLRSVLNQGRSTLSSIERAVSSFDRNPSRVIFGGSDGPRYQPQRR
ncbi:MAG: hypothetical protein AAF615_08245, partial [Pseudomonadota bacterium]